MAVVRALDTHPLALKLSAPRIGIRAGVANIARWAVALTHARGGQTGFSTTMGAVETLTALVERSVVPWCVACALLLTCFTNQRRIADLTVWTIRILRALDTHAIETNRQCAGTLHRVAWIACATAIIAKATRPFIVPFTEHDVACDHFAGRIVWTASPAFGDTKLGSRFSMATAASSALSVVDAITTRRYRHGALAIGWIADLTLCASINETPGTMGNLGETGHCAGTRCLTTIPTG